MGVNNHNSFKVFLISLSLCFIAILASCLETMIAPCPDGKDCPLIELCVGCDIVWLRYTVIVLSILLTIFFSAPVFFLSVIQVRNFTLNKTSNERFARNARTQSATSELESASNFTESMIGVGDENLSLLSKTGGRNKKKKGCWLNCKTMCCNKQIMTQERLYQVYLAEATESSRTSVLEDD